MSSPTEVQSPPEVPEPPVSIMFDHCLRLYKAMLAEASLQDGEDGEMVVWEGRLTKMVSDLNYSVPYYTKLKDHLVRMGCIRQLRRGGGTAPSVWWLKCEPTEELFKAKGLRRPSKDPTAQMLHDLNERVTVLETTLMRLAEGDN